MSYLSREAAPFSGDLWPQIDSAVVKAARAVLTGRRFLHVFGPLGAGAGFVPVDDANAVDEVTQDGVITTVARKYVQIPTIFEDFTLLAKDLESAGRPGLPIDLSKAMAAAESCALKEDRLIFFGNAALGYDGLLTAPGVNKTAKKDWSKGENAFADIAAAVELLTEKGVYGSYCLVVSPDLYMQLQRLQPGTGLLEIDRIEKLLNGHILRTPVLGKNKAALLCPDERNIDLVIGQDMATAYLEQKELNHSLRVLESVLPRIKRSQAIVVFE